MPNVVSLQPARPRPQPASGLPRGGAQILFFTGVRYVRDEDDSSAARSAPALVIRLSDRPLDAAAH